MPDKSNAGSTLTDLEKQVDGLINQIEGVLKMSENKEGDVNKNQNPDDSDQDEYDLTGSWRDNLSGWKRTVRNHTQQVDSPIRPEAAPDDEDDMAKRFEQAAELIGIDPAYLVGALTKAKPPWLQGKDDEEDSEDCGPTKKSASEENSETVTIEGQQISKAAVGEGVFNVLKAQSDKIEKQRMDIQKAQDEAEMEKLKKRADDQYSHVPGTTEERAQLLKAMSAMPDSMRKSMEKVLMQAEKLAKSAFDRVGTTGGRDMADMRKSKADFDKKVSEIAKRDGCTRTEAMAKARMEDPEAFQAFQGNGN